ncbi:hypothetical protein BLA39750_00129 [Burkholderia lata]|uniref:Uncharacterized protein n=1 Tax=Burkholderia lata (strain ATCC 17760 / DSM 23089 / LMG 22485 / NCIMB 9086 / R18194 / 383) TaxID=482957 RepID=A0A6P2U803_BURL3|nr:hypothetical protein BLA39750_00129 [Burkholderia lata]
MRCSRFRTAAQLWPTRQRSPPTLPLSHQPGRTCRQADRWRRRLPGLRTKRRNRGPCRQVRRLAGAGRQQQKQHQHAPSHVFPSIFSIPLLLASDPVALVALGNETPDSIRLCFDDGRLIGVAMSLAITTSRTDDDGGDNGQPETRVEQHHRPRSHSKRSNARRFTSPGSTRPPPYTHCCLPLLVRRYLDLHPRVVLPVPLDFVRFELAVRRSPFAVRRSPFAVRRSPFASITAKSGV